MSLNNKCAKCGCEDSYLTTPPPCPTAIGCPFEECAEIQYAQCIMYTGDDILCGEDLVVPADTNMEAAITNIVDYFCDQTTITVDIDCNETTVVAADTNVVNAIEDVVDYFCTEISNVPTVTVVGDNGIDVTSVVVGNNTEYTVTATGVKKFVKEFTGVVFDDQTLTITGAELSTCGLLSDACGSSTNRFSDFTFNIMFLLTGRWISLTNETGVSVEANDTTGDISIILDIAPIDPGVTVRVTIIG